MNSSTFGVMNVVFGASAAAHSPSPALFSWESPENWIADIEELTLIY